MNKKHFRELVAYAFRNVPQGMLPYLAKLPRVGKFAEAYALWIEPFARPLPVTGATALEHIHAADLQLRLQPATGTTGAVAHHGAENNFVGKKVALLAHWDAQATVAPYVRFYAQALKQLGYNVVLATGCTPKLSDDDRSVFAAIVSRQSKGYDFTSWRAAFEGMPSLYMAAEIILTNDSIFGPVGPLSPLLDSMKDVPCDFWGIIESDAVSTHLQSYFIVLKDKAINSTAFKEFVEHIGFCSEKWIAMGYEQEFSKWLVMHGLRAGARFSASLFKPTSLNPSHYAWNSLLQSGYFPFLKRELLFENPYAVPTASAKKLLEERNYPYELIINTTK